MVYNTVYSAFFPDLWQQLSSNYYFAQYTTAGNTLTCTPTNVSDTALKNVLTKYLPAGDANAGLDPTTNTLDDYLCRNQELYMALDKLMQTNTNSAADADMTALHGDKFKHICYIVAGIVVMLCVIRTL